MLVIQPIGGKDDWEALFHEAGHTEHYAHTTDDLPIEAKRLGDMAVTEGWATLLEHLVTEPAWLNRRLDVPRPADLAHDGAVSLLYFVRRYAAKLLYEIEFFQADDVDADAARYAEILGDALKLPVNPESYLDDIDGSFYVTGYLRSWAFEAQLRDFLRSEFGNDWFAKRDAGDLLRELWSLGQGPTADELLKDVTGAKLEMASVAERIREGSTADPALAFVLIRFLRTSHRLVGPPMPLPVRTTLRRGAAGADCARRRTGSRGALRPLRPRRLRARRARPARPDPRRGRRAGCVPGRMAHRSRASIPRAARCRPG